MQIPNHMNTTKCKKRLLYRVSFTSHTRSGTFEDFFTNWWSRSTILLEGISTSSARTSLGRFVARQPPSTCLAHKTPRTHPRRSMLGCLSLQALKALNKSRICHPTGCKPNLLSMWLDWYMTFNPLSKLGEQVRKLGRSIICLSTEPQHRFQMYNRN